MKLEICIPTYNRSNCIERYLKYLRDFVDKYDFGVFIVDSSNNDDTLNVVKNYSFVRYEKIDSSTNIDVKTIYILKNSVADYVFLCGDGYIPKIDNFFKTIDFNKNYDVIAIYDVNMSNGREKYFELHNKDEYTDKNEFFIDHFSMLTLYGGGIISHRLINCINDDVVKKYYFKNFVYPCTIVTYSDGIYKAYKGDYLLEISNKKYPGWIERKEAIKIWGKNFVDSIEQLVPYLNCNTINAIIKGEKNSPTDFFSIKSLMWLKSTDNYNLRIYKDYKEYIFKRLRTSRFNAKIIALTPKFIICIIRKIYQIIKPHNKF